MANLSFREQFRKELEGVSKYTEEDVDYLMDDLDNWNFFSMPASCKKHGCYEGGLAEHSLNVCRMAKILREQAIAVRPDMEEQLPLDSVIIASLLHDVCKAGIYQIVVRSKKNEIGMWEQYTTYGVDYSYLPVGHGEKSVIMLLRAGVDLSEDEILAIRWHMGPWDIPYQSQEMIGSHNKAREITPLVTLVHAADALAADLMERPAKTIN